MPTYTGSNSSTTTSTTIANERTEEFIDVAAATTNINLLSSPTSVVEVLRNGIELLSNEYSIAANVLTLVDPIGVSTGATNGEDIVITYKY